MKSKKDLERIKLILNWVWKNKYSDFYRKKYRKAGIDPSRIKTWDDFEKLPFLERREIAQTGPYDRIFVPQKEIKGLRVTSGTSKQEPLIFFYKKSSMKYRGKEVSVTSDHLIYEKLKKLGAKRLASFRSTLQSNMYWLEPSTNDFRLFLDMNSLSVSALIASKARIDAIESTPTTLYFFIPYLKEKYDLGKIKFIKLGGEYCSEQKMQLFRLLFPNALIFRGYGSTEDLMRGWQCFELAKKGSKLFHVFSENKYIENIDPQTGKNVDFDQQGECVVTTTEKFAFPVIRYKTGDRIVIRKEKCTCGSKAPLFEVLGRIEDDSVSIQGARLTRFMTDKVVQKLSTDIAADYRFHIYEKIVNGTVIYKIEAELIPKKSQILTNEKFKARIKKIISENLYLSSTLTLNDLIDKGLFLPLEVKLVEHIPFENKRNIFVTHY